jgi:hypothetical protein
MGIDAAKKGVLLSTTQVTQYPRIYHPSLKERLENLTRHAQSVAAAYCETSCQIKSPSPRSIGLSTSTNGTQFNAFWAEQGS